MIGAPISIWFELSYNSYAVQPRMILEAMPEEWQERFVKMLEEVEEKFPDIQTPAYEVHAKHNGKFTKDPFRCYRRGNVQDAMKELNND